MAFVEACRMLQTWFRDGTNGIAAHLANIPRYGGDSAPPTITSANILEETSDNMVAVNQLPDGAGPFVLVGLVAGEESPDNAVNDVGDGSLIVEIAYLTRETAAGTAKRHAGYTLRAVVWSLRRLHGEAGRTTMDSQNSIQFFQGGPIEFKNTMVPLTDAMVLGVVRSHYRFRDNGLSGG